MADETVTVRVEDLLPVRSRLSWGAILGGAVVAMASYLVLTLLGGAIGLSVSENVEGETLGIGAAIWAIAAAVIAFFIGGMITSRCAAGENRMEAAVHAIVMWGTVFAMLLWLVASGVRTGLGAMIGMASAGTEAAQTMNWEQAARQAGVSQEQIAQWRQSAENAVADAAQAAQDPAQRQQALEATGEAARQATWWTLAGTVLTIISAIIGGFVGKGPTFELREVRTVEGRRTFETRLAPA
jgi:hypothetical protein